MTQEVAQETALEKLGDFFLKMMEFGWPGMCVIIAIIVASAWLGHALIPVVLMFLKSKISKWAPGVKKP